MADEPNAPHRHETQSSASVAEEHLALGNAQFDAEQFAEAVENYQQAIRLNPNLIAAHENLGVALANLGRMIEAIACFHRIAQLKPDDPESHLNLGLALMDQGMHDEAIAWFQRAIRIRPDYAEAHSNLGMAIHAKGLLGEAIAHYRHAVELKPDFAEALNNLGVALRERGDISTAADCFRRAAAGKPDFAEAINNLGNIYSSTGQWAEAMACFRKTAELRPGEVDPLCNLGRACKRVGNLAEAARCFEQAAEMKPDFAEAHLGLGTIHHAHGRTNEAIACFRQALEFNDRYADAHQNLGMALQALGDHAAAVDCYRRALDLNPNVPEVHNNLGAALRSEGRPTEAVDSFRRALTLKPDYADAHDNLGGALAELGRFKDAAVHCERSCQLKPNNADAQSNLATILHELGRSDESLRAYRRALALAPDRTADLGHVIHQMQHVCKWDDIDALSKMAIQFVERGGASGPGRAISPFVFIALPTPTTAAQQRTCAEQWVAHHLSTSHAHPPIHRQPASRRRDERITVAYLSADFLEHAVAYVIAEMIEKHSRSEFRVVGYSIGPDRDSPIRSRLMQAFDEFVELRHLSHADAARRIAADGVDILVDLMGHTRNARTAILAARPAPIQVNYLGFPGTMGAPFIDYILVDPTIVPPDQQIHFTEKLAFLPECYQVNDRCRVVADRTPSRAECGLPDDGFVFCCFNNSYKIAQPTFDVWMELLRETPRSVLWLWERNRSVSANLRREAGARDVAPERLVFMPRCEHADYLARYRLADLVLDTFTYTAHGTGSDALWMGCPLLTRMGETLASRVAASLLTNVGVPELITTSISQYRATALNLAHSPDRLRELRNRLMANRDQCALFDTDRFVRNIEAVYRKMWQDYAADHPM